MAILRIPVTEDDHIQGNANASITLIEYGDYGCPFCAMANQVIKQVQSQNGDQLRFIFRHFPLTEVHPQAEMAAEAAEFAGHNGLFWDMHSLIYDNQKNLSLSLLLKLAEGLKLSPTDLENAIMRKAYELKIRRDFIGGVRSGVNGTPTFFINGERYNGSFEGLELVIQSALASVTAQKVKQ